MEDDDNTTPPHDGAAATTSADDEANDDSSCFEKISADDRVKIKASRKLTKDEVSALCRLVKQEFNIVDEDTDDDVATFSEYAVDMIDRGKNVETVMKELQALEMSILDTANSTKVSLILSKFLHNLNHTSTQRSSGLICSSLIPEKKVDLSAGALARKYRGELESQSLSGTKSHKARTNKYMRKASGEKGNELNLLPQADKLKLLAENYKKNRTGEDNIEGFEKVDANMKLRSKDAERNTLTALAENYKRRASNPGPSDVSSGEEMDLSARSSANKYRDELQLLRSNSVRARHGDYIRKISNPGNPDDYFSDDSDRGYQISSNKDFDALSMEDRMEVTACRKLTTSETMTLYKIMKDKLNVVDDESDEDADTLLDYVLDMIDKGKSVGMVVKELGMMEMRVCDADASQRVALVLSKYLFYLSGVNLSSYAKAKQNRDELQSIRSDSVRTRKDEYIRRASNPGDHGADGSMSTSGKEVDLSARASANKHRDELQSLRSSTQNDKERADTHGHSSTTKESVVLDFSDDSDRGYQISSNKDFDALSMEDRMEVTACRKLTTSETMTLYKIMKGKLNVVDDESDEDADTLLDYVLDMIDEGKSVGMVVKELGMMEMRVCDADASQRVALVLSKYLFYLSGVNLSPYAKAKQNRDELQSIRSDSVRTRKDEYIRRASNPGDHGADGSMSTSGKEVDLSARASANKHRDELQSLRSSTQNDKERVDTHVHSSTTKESVVLDFSDDSDRGYQISSNKDFDALSMEDRMEVTACRKLTTSETMTLYKIMKGKLNVVDDESDEDADTLLDYVLDMVDEGKSVGMVVKELGMMEMRVCDADASQRVALVLSKYLFYLSGSFEKEVNLSSYAKAKQNRDELQSIRSDSVRTRKDEYIRRASNPGDPGADGSMSTSGKEVDLSARASANKHRDELQSLRSSTQNDKERVDTHVHSSTTKESVVLDFSDDSDRGYQISSNKDFDALSMEDRMEVTACRKLTTSETMTLYKIMKGKLNVVDDESDEDADTLLDYVLDMVDEGKSVGMVVKELGMMEMRVCDADASQRVALVLSKYLFYLSGSFEKEVNLSPYAKAKQNRDELQSIRSDSVRTRKDEYIRRASNPGDPGADGSMSTSGKEVDLSARSSANKHRDELQSLKSKSVESIRARQDNYIRRASNSSEDLNIDVPWNSSGTDLSALAASKKHSSELADLFAIVNFAEKIDQYNKRIERDKMYFESGDVVIINGVERDWNKIKREEEVPADKEFIDLNGIFDPKKLGEIASNSLRQTLQAQLNITRDSPEEQVSSFLDYAMDMILSGSNIGTVVKELEFLQMDLCDDIVAKQLGKCLSDFLRRLQSDSVESYHAKRQEELQSIMQDKSLGKEERAMKMAAVKQKYANAGSEETGPNESVFVDLSAKAAAKKHQIELQSFNTSAGDKAKQKKDSIYSETGDLKQWRFEDSESKNSDDVDVSTKKYFKRMSFDAGSNRQAYYDNQFLKKQSTASERREELQAIMQDKSLGKEERAMKMAAVKQKYANAGSEETGPNESVIVDLSAKAAAKKHQIELQSFNTSAGDKAKQKKDSIYSETGDLKQWRFEDSESKNSDDVDVSTKKYFKRMSFDAGSNRQAYYDNQFLKKQSTASERREELQAIMQDKSLGKEERAKMIEEVKLKYIAQVETELDAHRSKELQDIIKDKTLGKGDRIKKMKEIKLKYDEKFKQMLS